MSDKDTIYRQDAIEAVCSACGYDCDEREFVYNAPRDEQVIMCPEHYALSTLPSAEQCMTATSNTMVSDTIKIPVMDGTTERLPSAQLNQLDETRLSQGIWTKVCKITDSEGLQHEVIHYGDLKAVIEEVTGWMI